MQVQELSTTRVDNFVVFYIYQKSRGLTLEVILRKYFSTHNKLGNDLLVRDFVKLHYHHDAKVMDLNFIRRNKESIVSSFLEDQPSNLFSKDRLCIITKRMVIIVCIIYVYLYLCDTFY